MTGNNLSNVYLVTYADYDIYDIDSIYLSKDMALARAEFLNKQRILRAGNPKHLTSYWKSYYSVDTYPIRMEVDFDAED